MGWLKLPRKAEGPTVTGEQYPNPTSQPDDFKATIQHMETLSISDQSSSLSPAVFKQVQSQPRKTQKYPFQPENTPDSELPFIPASEVASKSEESSSKLQEDLWIVVDGIVYDCTEFVHIHPGGEDVIQSFQGQDCSWQFWRFHGKEQMECDGLPLRIGRTEGVRNRFPEPPRYVGLKSLGAMDDDW